MVVEKRNLMRKPAGDRSGKVADFEGAFKTKDSSVKKQLTLKIDEDLHRKVKSYAAEHGTTITDVVSEFIRDL